jgi:hypothetical protein
MSMLAVIDVLVLDGENPHSCRVAFLRKATLLCGSQSTTPAWGDHEATTDPAHHSQGCVELIYPQSITVLSCVMTHNSTGSGTANQLFNLPRM